MQVHEGWLDALVPGVTSLAKVYSFLRMGRHKSAEAVAAAHNARQAELRELQTQVSTTRRCSEHQRVQLDYLCFDIDVDAIASSGCCDAVAAEFFDAATFLLTIGWQHMVFKAHTYQDCYHIATRLPAVVAVMKVMAVQACLPAPPAYSLFMRLSITWPAVQGGAYTGFCNEVLDAYHRQQRYLKFDSVAAFDQLHDVLAGLHIKTTAILEALKAQPARQPATPPAPMFSSPSRPPQPGNQRSAKDQVGLHASLHCVAQ